jgi:hypothetical protein
MTWSENMFFATLSLAMPEVPVHKSERIKVPKRGHLNFPATIYTLGQVCVYAYMYACTYMYLSVCIYVCM